MRGFDRVNGVLLDKYTREVRLERFSPLCLEKEKASELNLETAKPAANPAYLSFHI